MIYLRIFNDLLQQGADGSGDDGAEGDSDEDNNDYDGISPVTAHLDFSLSRATHSFAIWYKTISAS